VRCDLKLLEIWEWGNFKDETRLKARYRYNETYMPYMKKAAQEYNIKMSGWTDGSGHMVYLVEYESAEDHARAWSDDEFYGKYVRFCRLIRNHSRRIFRPPLRVQPE